MHRQWFYYSTSLGDIIGVIQTYVSTLPVGSTLIRSHLKATFLSAIADSIQFVVLVIILPYVRVYLVTSRKWAGYQCDLIIAVVGVYSLTLGTLMLGLGSSIKLAIIGNFSPFTSPAA